MNPPTTLPQAFLVGQQLSELDPAIEPADRRGFVCGTTGSGRSERRDAGDEGNPWRSVGRPHLLEKLCGPDAPRRVALVCDAGLGKTTNLKWLAAELGGGAGARLVPLFVPLDEPSGRQLLQQERDGYEAL